MNTGTYRTQSTGTNGFVKVATSALIVVSMLGSPTTSNANQSRVTTERTSSAPSNAIYTSTALEDTPSTARGILAIRQIANLTWDETAKVFDVSRRTVHLWANGRHPSGDQERKINRVLGILRPYESLGPSLFREKLMTSWKPGTLYFDLLCRDEFEAFQDAFWGTDSSREFPPPAISLETGRNAAPSPILLLDALQDRPIEASKAIAKKTVRLKRQVS